MLIIIIIINDSSLKNKEMRHREVRKLAQVAQLGREKLGFKLRLGTRQPKLPVPLFCTPAPAQSLPFPLAGI